LDKERFMSKPEKPNETPEKDAETKEGSKKELTIEELESVAGGTKHIAGVKYEDLSITVTSTSTK
jgi:bacteriocin-like protein